MDALTIRGTKAFTLKPSSVVSAAERDLAMRTGGPLKRQGRFYAFHRRHVALASSALDLLDRAIADRYSGVYSGKRITRLLYSQDGLLEAARETLLVEPAAAR